ncbi:hypothetical protein ABIE85_000964 [Bradyrhizobium diazoefficiens]
MPDPDPLRLMSVRFSGAKWHCLDLACTTANLEAIALRAVLRTIGGENSSFRPSDLRHINVRRTADDDLVAGLAGARGGASEDTPTRAGFAKDYMGQDSRPGVLVPDLQEFPRQNSCLMTLIRIDR